MKSHFDLRVPTLLIVGGAISLYHHYRSWRLSRDMETTNVVPVHSAPQGLVELQGFAWPSQPVMAPLHHGPAAFCRLVIEQQTTHGGSKGWSRVADIQAADHFFLADKTGTVVVCPVGAEMDLPPARLLYSQLNSDQKGQIGRILNDKAPGIDLERSFLSTYRVTEYALAAGSPVYVAGHLTSLPSSYSKMPFHGLGGFLEKVAHFESSPMSRLVGARGHGNSVPIATFEYYRQLALEAAHDFQLGDFARAGGDAGVVSGSGSGSGRDAPEPRCFGTVAVSNEHRLFIANCGRSEALKHLNQWLWLKVFASAAAIAAGVVLILAEFHVSGF